MEPKNLFKLSVFGTALLIGDVFSACSNSNDLYDPNYANEQKKTEYNNNWSSIIGSIDPTQDWNLMTSRQVSVNINLGTTNDYTLKIFDKDPSFKSNDAKLIATANAKGGATTSFNVNIPTAMSTIYVACADVSGLSVVEAANLNSNSFSTTIGDASTKAINSRATPNSGDNWTVSSDFETYDGNIVNEVLNQLPEEHDASSLTSDFAFVSQGVPFYVNPIYGCEDAQDEVGYIAIDPQTQNNTTHILITNSRDNNEIGNMIHLFWNSVSKGTTDRWGNFTSTGTVSNFEYPFSISTTSDKYWNITNPFTLDYNNNSYEITSAPDQLKSKGFIINEPAGTQIVFYVKNNYDSNAYHTMTSLKSMNNDGQIHSAVVNSSDGNYTFVGMEDYYNVSKSDCNDIVFAVKGAKVITTTTDTPFNYTIAFEDLGSTNDYDFNDVVLDVSYTQRVTTTNVGGSTTTTTYTMGPVKLVAAGGTLPVKVYYKKDDGTIIDLFEKEVHEAFGVSESTMVNTGTGTTKDPVISTKLAELPEFSIATNDINKGFYIEVQNGETTNTVELPNTTGTAPQGFVVPTTWSWPTEKTCISDAYPTFPAWAASRTTNTDWYNNAVSDKIYK